MRIQAGSRGGPGGTGTPTFGEPCQKNLQGLIVVPGTATTMVMKAEVSTISGATERRSTSPQGVFVVTATQTWASRDPDRGRSCFVSRGGEPCFSLYRGSSSRTTDGPGAQAAIAATFARALLIAP